MRKLLYLSAILLTVSLFATGCTTASMSLHSNPAGVDVYMKPVGNAEVMLVGQTPLTLTSKDLEKFNSDHGAVYVELRKDGYKTDGFYVTETSKVDLNIVREMYATRDLESQVWLNQKVERLFEVTRLVQAKRFEAALELVRSLKMDLPMVSTVHELEGGILLLQGQVRSALDAYRLAARYNPESIEAVEMVRKLEKTYGFAREVGVTDTGLITPVDGTRVPASTGNRGPTTDGKGSGQ